MDALRPDDQVAKEVGEEGYERAETETSPYGTGPCRRAQPVRSSFSEGARRKVEDEDFIETYILLLSTVVILPPLASANLFETIITR